MATEFPLLVGSAKCSVIYDTQLQTWKQGKINMAGTKS